MSEFAMIADQRIKERLESLSSNFPSEMAIEKIRLKEKLNQARGQEVNSLIDTAFN